MPSTSFQHVLLSRWQADFYARRIVYFSRLKAKYERAAARPWLPVAPDPPLPK